MNIDCNARKDSHEESEGYPLLFSSLPESLWGDIWQFTTLSEMFRVLATCRVLWERHRFVMVQTLIFRLRLESTKESWGFLLTSRRGGGGGEWGNLLSMDAQSYATNAFVWTLHDHCPQLQEWRMVGSKKITDEGLRCIVSQPQLRLLDITYCSGTTYGGTFPVRDAHRKANKHNKNYQRLVIRRQPEWMDGKYDTRFDNDGLHTYWPDGTFRYERREQNCGYIDSIHPWSTDNPHHIRDKIQFADFKAPNSWPPWVVGYAYRPGVSILRLADEAEKQDEDGNPCHHVLVAQVVRGLLPPSGYPRPQDKDIPLGTSQYFNSDGQHVARQAQDASVMVTKMRVYPLDDPHPPPDLIKKNRALCKKLPTGVNLDLAAENLHRMLEGAPLP